jgi:ethanolamine permease
VLALIGLIGLIASFFTIIYAYGRNTYSLSRAGYFPQVLSITHPTRHTPYVALIAGAVVGFIVAFVIWWLGQQAENPVAGKIVGALLYMAVFGAVISYFMQCVAFIMLRRRLPNIERPYRSPVGVWGAAIAGAIALVALVSLFLNPDYFPGVAGTAVYFVMGLIYFAIAGRHKLVLSPEEEFAMTQGQYGVNLEEEGYGAVSVTDIKADDSSTRTET